MTGVEVLATQEIVTGYSFSWSIYLIAFAAIAIVMTIISILTIEDVIISLIIGCIFGALLAMLPARFMCPSEYVTQYKVTISDEVSMNEFLSKYEIISQEGHIYTVRSREEPND